MFRKTVIAATLMAAVFALAGARLSAQADSAKAPDAEKALSSYRLDYTLSELDDGKKINTRQYSMHSRPNDWNEIKIGTRVPDEPKAGEFQYLDVGMNIRCRLDDPGNLAAGGNVALNVQSDLSNFAIPEQQGQTMRPAIRQMKIQASTVVPLNKPTVVGVVDDPNSKHQYQLEVTVTKLR